MKTGFVADGFWRLYSEVTSQVEKERAAELRNATRSERRTIEKAIEDEVWRRMHNLGANDQTCW